MFDWLVEMATTTAYKMYRCHHDEALTSSNGFHHEFNCDLVRRMVDVADQSSRRRSAAIVPENAFGGGYRLEKSEDWVG